MSVYVVILKSNKLISVGKNWVRNPILNTKSLVYFSADEQEEPYFNSKRLFYFQPTVSGCYESEVLKEFVMYISKKIVIFAY